MLAVAAAFTKFIQKFLSKLLPGLSGKFVNASFQVRKIIGDRVKFSQRLKKQFSLQKESDDRESVLWFGLVCDFTNHSFDCCRRNRSRRHSKFPVVLQRRYSHKLRPNLKDALIDDDGPPGEIQRDLSTSVRIEWGHVSKRPDRCNDPAGRSSR